jgi:DNA polymerase
LKLDTIKDEEAKRVMMKLSKYRKSSKKDAWVVHEKQEDYDALYQYCIQDVLAERAIDKRLKDLNPKELSVWLYDQQINSHGIYIDRAAVMRALGHLENMQRMYQDSIGEITNYEVTKGTQVAQLRRWLETRGVLTDSLDKASVLELLKDPDLPEDVKDVLTIRKETGKSSTAKYHAMLDALCDDDRIRDYLMYHGASTGRWSGRIVQFHNIPKGSIEDMDKAVAEIMTLTPEDYFNTYQRPMDQLSGCLRGMLCAPPGKDLIFADYSAIEARVVMWLAGEEDGLEVFRSGGDIYKVMASDVYKVPVDNVTKDQRFMGKQAVLGLGYQMGANKFAATCESYGVSVPIEFAQTVVEIYRSKFWRIKKQWYLQEESAIRAVRNPGTIIKSDKVDWLCVDGFLWCRLPSGRKLAYYDPKVDYVIKFGSERPELTHMGMNSMTRQWERQHTYGGKLVENISQGVARDIMAEAMLKLDAQGYQTVLTIHDEIVSEVKENFGSVDDFCAIMSATPEWATGLPVAAEGWRGKRYKK